MADQVFDALTDGHRRRLLVALVDHNPQTTTEPARVPQESPAEVQVRMHHVHLPKLADYGFVEWDRDERVVIKGPRFDEIEPVLELMVDHRDELPAGCL